MNPILCLDFDGVLHGYDSGWKGAHVIPDAPVDGAGLYLLKTVQHFRVAIYSSRSRSLRGRRAMRRYIRKMLWDACLAHTDETERAWAATQGKPAEWIPWTAYDVRDVADHIGGKIEWPWFKPSATITIDDRALTFNGDWSHPDFQPAAIHAFKPWNKRVARTLYALLLVFIAGSAGAQTPGEVPDDRLTPGVVASTDEVEVCGTVDGLTYSKRHRQTPVGLKALIFRKYGVDQQTARTQDWEIDHRVPLALGGEDSAYNLWPEPGDDLGVCYTYHLKDHEEVFLWQSVCKHHTMKLADAQQILLGDWRVDYRKNFGKPPCLPVD